MLITGNIAIRGKPVTFTSIEETQVPALQNHCLALVAATRAPAAISLIKGLNQLTASLCKRFSEEGTGQITEKERVDLQARWSTKDDNLLLLQKYVVSSGMLIHLLTISSTSRCSVNTMKSRTMSTWVWVQAYERYSLSSITDASI